MRASRRYPADTARGAVVMVADSGPVDGPVDVLVGNAGVMPMGGFCAQAEALSRSTIDVNVLGLVHGTRLLRSAVRDRRALTDLDLAARAAYEQRVAGQARAQGEERS